MAQRISGRSGRSPSRACRSGCRRRRAAGDALRNVLHVLYLIFNEGYASSQAATLHRVDLSDEAIRLAGCVHAAAPRRPRGRRACSR